MQIQIKSYFSPSLQLCCLFCLGVEIIHEKLNLSAQGASNSMSCRIFYIGGSFGCSFLRNQLLSETTITFPR